MVDQRQALIICKDFIRDILPDEAWFKSVKPHTLATLLYGSVAKGTNRPDSDIDILMIMPLEIEEKNTIGEYFYKYKVYEINIVIRSIERLRKIAHGQKDKSQKEVFKDSVVIESDQEVKDLLTQIKSIN